MKVSKLSIAPPTLTGRNSFWFISPLFLWNHTWRNSSQDCSFNFILKIFHHCGSFIYSSKLNSGTLGSFLLLSVGKFFTPTHANVLNGWSLITFLRSFFFNKIITFIQGATQRSVYLLLCESQRRHLFLVPAIKYRL